MKKLLKGIVPGLLLVSLATPAAAENRQGAVTVSPFVGGYVLDKHQSFESRPVFGLRAGYNFTKHIGAEAMFGYSLTETKLNMRSAASKETDLYKYGVDILYHFMPDNAFVPFVEVGGGVTHFHVADTPSIKEPYYIGQVNYGAGVKYFIAPDVALRADVRHAILVQDPADNNLEYAVGLTFNFGGVRKTVAAVAEPADVADTTAPAVVFTAPVNGATQVAVNQKANVAFSEDMDPATITAETVTLKQGNTAIAGRVTSVGSTATFAPSRNFENGKVYTGVVTTGAKDLAGNPLANNYMWEFNAGPATDTTAPTVVFTSPVKGATATPARQSVNVAFSETMDSTTITTETFTLKQGTTPVSGKVTAAASSATFNPSRKLEKGKTYTAAVTTGTKDLAGNALAHDYVWEFKAYDAPKVIGVLAKLDKSHFDFNSAEISENGRTILNANAVTLKAKPAMQIRVAGYTSAAGTDEYNQALSERRAEAVKDYLVKSGIAADRLTTIGYGEKDPARFEANPADKLSDAALANMRVVMEIIEE